MIPRNRRQQGPYLVICIGFALWFTLFLSVNAIPQEPPVAPWTYGTTWHRWPGATNEAPPPFRLVAPPIPPLQPRGVRLVKNDPDDEKENASAPVLFGKPTVFQLESEQRWRTRVQAEARQAKKESFTFPADPQLPQSPRQLPFGSVKIVRVEPAQVSYQRLIFEEKNSERYGWDLGAVHPLLLTADFYGRVLAAPALRLVDPCRGSESNAGYCLPGDPVPYYLYLPQRPSQPTRP